MVHHPGNTLTGAYLMPLRAPQVGNRFPLKGAALPRKPAVGVLHPRRTGTSKFLTALYAFDSGDHGAALFNLEVEGFRYSRIGNPTTAVLERRVTALEGGLETLRLSVGIRTQTTSSTTSIKRSMRPFTGEGGPDSFTDRIREDTLADVVFRTRFPGP